jgi:oxygen-dependent protoporphyrinogen oxidase
MESLVAAVAQRLPEGVVRLRAPVTDLGWEGLRWRLRAGGEALDADQVVLATPAHRAGGLLEPLDPVLARALGAIEHASSATVSLGFRSASLPPLAGFGFVVPAIERRPLLACTFSSRKYPGRSPEGHDLLRAFVGGARRPDLVDLGDDALVRVVRDELRALVGIGAEPILARVRRWPRAMPQYTVGHLDRIAAIEARVAALPGIALVGASYRGVGIPDCVRGAEEAADALFDALR